MPSEPKNCAAVGGYAVSVKQKPVEEHKESGIILDLTRCGQRLNTRFVRSRSGAGGPVRGLSRRPDPR